MLGCKLFMFKHTLRCFRFPGMHVCKSIHIIDYLETMCHFTQQRPGHYRSFSFLTKVSVGQSSLTKDYTKASAPLRPSNRASAVSTFVKDLFATPTLWASEKVMGQTKGLVDLIEIVI